jgi:hypothetical protein
VLTWSNLTENIYTIEITYSSTDPNKKYDDGKLTVYLTITNREKVVNAIGETQIDSNDIGGNYKRIKIINGEGLQTLKVNGLTNLVNLDISSCTNLQTLDISETSISAIDLTSYTHLTTLLCTNNTALTSIEIPDSITTISSGAFEGCTSLQTIDISNATWIGDNVFANCSSLSNVT